MIEPLFTGSNPTPAEHLEAAAIQLFDAKENCVRLSRLGRDIGLGEMAPVALHIHNALILLELAGVPTPRLPTEAEMNR